MEASLHRLTKDVLCQQDLAVVLNAALETLSKPDRAKAYMEHMSKLNGGWGNPLIQVEELRESLKCLTRLAENSDQFSFRTLSNPDIELGEGKFHFAMIKPEDADRTPK